MRRTGRSLSTLVLITFCLGPSPLWAQDLKKIPVHFELEDDRAELSGQVELKNISQADLAPKVLGFRGRQVRLELEPALYQMRIRSRDERGVPGEWSAPQELLVRPKKVKSLGHGEKDLVRVSEKTLKAKIHFQWSSAKGASQYRLELIGSGDAEPSLYVISDLSHDLDLAPGVYQWSVRSIAESKVLSDSSEFKQLTIKGPQMHSPRPGEESAGTIQIKNFDELSNLAARGTVLRAVIETSRYESSEWTKVSELESSLLKTFQLPKLESAGRYRVWIWASAPQWDDSEKQKIEFVRKPRTQELLN